VPAGFGHIFQKWINVTTKPGVQSFATETATANWADVWIGLLLLGVVSAITGFIGRAAVAGIIANSMANIPPDQRAQFDRFFNTAYGPGASIGSIITVPLIFFIWTGILFLIAKMFGGSGTFLQQSYARSLYYVPLMGISTIVGLVPVLGGLVAFGLLVYGTILNIFSVSASQRITTGKATAVVLLPAAIGLILLCVLIGAIIALVVAATRGITT
jgi:hypothetical protein